MSLEEFTVMLDISIHAPAKGATLFLTRLTLGSRFQSTLPRRERRITDLSLPSYIIISIHAPAKGATNLIFCHLHLLFISIHAPAKGATEG